MTQQVKATEPSSSDPDPAKSARDERGTLFTRVRDPLMAQALVARFGRFRAA
jgi:hypothetical protein